MVHPNKYLAVVFLFAVGCAPAVLDFETSASTTTTTTGTSAQTETTNTTETTTSVPTTNTTSVTTSTSTSTSTTTVTTDPEPSSFQWDGSRLVHIGDSCDEYLYEEGAEITEMPEYQDIVDGCPNCDRVFYVEVSPSDVCGYSVSSPVLRGIRWNSDQEATIYELYQDGGGYDSREYSDADVDGFDLTYIYDGDWYYSDGEVTLVPQWD